MTDSRFEETIKFSVVGLMVTPEFQKCKYIVENLYQSYPDKYEPPEVRAMLNVDWAEFLTTERRLRGGQMWALNKPVAVYCNNEFMGDDTALTKLISLRYLLPLSTDFYERGRQELRDHFTKLMETGRRCVYLMFSINRKIVGTMVFQLYDDIVPQTCSLFLDRCKSVHKDQRYSGVPVHRIVCPSWIQCGGYKMKPFKMRSENFAVPHDKRGVISMCNSGGHKDNSTQFLITLEQTDWMNLHYVAFGQLIHGDEVLQQIEKVPTAYNAPKVPVKICRAGEFTLCMPRPDEGEKSEELYTFLKRRILMNMYRNYSSIREEQFLEQDAKKATDELQKIFWKPDLMSHRPLQELPDRIVDNFNFIPGKASSCLLDKHDCTNCGCSRCLKLHVD